MRRCAIVLALVLAGAPALASEEADDAVARIGNTAISAASLVPFVQSLDPALRKQALTNPTLLNRLIGMELARKAVLDEAAKRRWQERPDVASKIARARDDTVFSTYMASVAKPPKDYPSDADISAAYERNPDAFMAPRQYRLQQIFVSASAGGANAEIAERKAAQLARLARTKIVDFAALARMRSDHKPSAELGGDLGWATEQQILSEIRGVVPGMEVGEVSDPIRTASGFHIVRLAATIPAGPRPLADVKDQLALMLRTSKLQEVEEAYLTGLLKTSPIAINQALLRKLFQSAP